MTELRFDDRVVVVTGAGRGVGRSHALLLAAKGARVVVADYGADLDGAGSSGGPAEDVVREIKDNGGEAVACYASVAEELAATGIVQTALDAWGRIDTVVNNAGIHDPGAFEQLTTAQHQRMIQVHYLGTLFVTRARPGPAPSRCGSPKGSPPSRAATFRTPTSSTRTTSSRPRSDELPRRPMT